MPTSTSIVKSESKTATCGVSPPKVSIPSEPFVRAIKRHVQSNRLEEGQKLLDMLNKNLATEDEWPKISREMQAILDEAWEGRNTRLQGPRDVTRNTFFVGDRNQYNENPKIDDALCHVG